MRLTIGHAVSGEGVVGGAAAGPGEAAHPARGFKSPRRGKVGRLAAGEIHRLRLHLALRQRESVSVQVIVYICVQLDERAPLPWSVVLGWACSPRLRLHRPRLLLPLRSWSQCLGCLQSWGKKKQFWHRKIIKYLFCLYTAHSNCISTKKSANFQGTFSQVKRKFPWIFNFCLECLKKCYHVFYS